MIKGTFSKGPRGFTLDGFAGDRNYLRVFEEFRDKEQHGDSEMFLVVSLLKTCSFSLSACSCWESVNLTLFGLCFLDWITLQVTS